MVVAVVSKVREPSTCKDPKLILPEPRISAVPFTLTTPVESAFKVPATSMSPGKVEEAGNVNVSPLGTYSALLLSNNNESSVLEAVYTTSASSVES